MNVIVSLDESCQRVDIVLRRICYKQDNFVVVDLIVLVKGVRFLVTFGLFLSLTLLSIIFLSQVALLESVRRAIPTGRSS